jgi:Ca2+-binding RTX toxin-like protein
MFNNRIQKFDPSGNFLTKFGTEGSSDVQLDRPAGIDLDSDGKVYISDRHNQRVAVFEPVVQCDPSTKGKTIIGTNGGDTLVGTEGSDTIVGRNGNDKLNGCGDSDKLLGDNGDDILTGGQGADFFRCGPGIDMITDFSAAEGDLARQCENLQSLQSQSTEGANGTSDQSLLALPH